MTPGAFCQPWNHYRPSSLWFRVAPWPTSNLLGLWSLDLTLPPLGRGGGSRRKSFLCFPRHGCNPAHHPLPHRYGCPGINPGQQWIWYFYSMSQNCNAVSLSHSLSIDKKSQTSPFTPWLNLMQFCSTSQQLHIG